VKLSLKAFLSGTCLTAADWILTEAFPALRFRGPFAVIHKYLFMALIRMGMNPHAPSSQYGLVARLLVLAFFTVASLLAIMIYKAIRSAQG